ncbi:MAG: hypothetical protein IPQ02_03360 [Saprospiraceae bacterium]|nr:hypothetical protein [Candidatus Defluviibacterium haderslevense]
MIPEVNISQLAKTGNLNPGLLRQYVSGTKKASEAQTEKLESNKGCKYEIKFYQPYCRLKEYKA